MTDEEPFPADLLEYAQNNQQTPAEKYIDTLLGKGEIPEDLQKKFFQITAPSLSLMSINSRKEYRDWIIYANASLTLYDICNPHNKINPYLRSQIDGITRKNLQNAINGFFMEMLTANTTIVKTQQESIRAPVATGNAGNTGITGRIKNFVRGK